jgi:hypothetical protein
MQVIKAANLLLRFLLELCILAILGYWGFGSGRQLLIKIGLGIGGPLLFAIVWGIFMAPKSSRRLQGTTFFIVELVIFGLAAAALYSMGQLTLTAIFGLLYVINRILLYLWKQY